MIRMAASLTGRDIAGPPADASPEERQILILAPTRNDAALTAQFLREAKIAARECEDMVDLCARGEKACGALLLAEEALSPESRARLLAMLARQPSWSDLPIIVITG